MPSGKERSQVSGLNRFWYLQFAARESRRHINAAALFVPYEHHKPEKNPQHEENIELNVFSLGMRFPQRPAENGTWKRYLGRSRLSMSMSLTTALDISQV
jgi:hypothetical protein